MFGDVLLVVIGLNCDQEAFRGDGSTSLISILGYSWIIGYYHCKHSVEIHLKVSTLGFHVSFPE